MGEIAQAIGAVSSLKQKASDATGGVVGSGGVFGGGVDTSDPGIMDVGGGLPPLNMVDMSGQGQSQSQAPMLAALLGGGQPSASSLYDPSLTQPAPQQEAPQAPIDNPYTTYDNVNSPAASIGSENDIVVNGDGWKPPNHEGWLGKVADVLLMLRGRAPAFKNRVDQKNLTDAMRGFQSHPEEAINRAEQVDPDYAARLSQNMSAVAANNALTEGRKQDLTNNITSNLQNQVGAILGNKNAEAIYQKVLPILNTQAEKAGIPLFSDKFDPEMLGQFAKSGLSVYQQQALAQNAQEHQDLQADRATDIDLRKAGLGIQEYNAKTNRAETEARIAALNQGSMAQRQALYKQVLGGASQIPWLYGGFMKGIFGSGSNGLPVPGTAYVSPDKSMAAKLNANGGWSIYDLSKGTQHAREVARLPGVSSLSGDNGGDFNQ